MYNNSVCIPFFYAKSALAIESTMGLSCAVSLGQQCSPQATKCSEVGETVLVANEQYNGMYARYSPQLKNADMGRAKKLRKRVKLV